MRNEKDVKDARDVKDAKTPLDLCRIRLAYRIRIISG